MKYFLSLELSEFLQAPIFRFQYRFNLLVIWKSKNQRRNATSLNTNERYCIKDRAMFWASEDGSYEENSKEQKTPLRPVLIFLLLFLSRKKVRKGH